MRCVFASLSLVATFVCGCSRPPETKDAAAQPAYFEVDVSTAGSITGVVSFSGKPPLRKSISMEQDPECAKLHAAAVQDESVIAAKSGGLAHAFVYVKQGLEGKRFEAPSAPVTLDQRGCWFAPRVLGIQVGQVLRVTNSDPVTHNVHPMAQVNREWNQSQSGGDPPLSRKFTRPEILIPVKCNIHRWMRALIGVVEHPYFAVTAADGSFAIRNLPPGEYTVAAVHEVLGAQEQKVSIGPAQSASLKLSFEGK